jgi:hypothetical protein
MGWEGIKGERKEGDKGTKGMRGERSKFFCISSIIIARTFWST